MKLAEIAVNLTDLSKKFSRTIPVNWNSTASDGYKKDKRTNETNRQKYDEQISIRKERPIHILGNEEKSEENKIAIRKNPAQSSY